MKKIILITCIAMTGILFAAAHNASSSDQYYSALDLDGAIMAEYDAQINSDGREGGKVYRKRAHRRKRIIRPPVQGK